MDYSGNLLKMKTELTLPVSYYLNFNDNQVNVNQWLGKQLTIRFENEINCIHCGRKTSKSFFQGYCYPCFTKLPQTDVGVLRPELSKAHEGISRDMEWSKKNDLIDHYVYLAITSGIKVGVTRYTQVPTRWMDQGAEYAIILAKTPYRQLAGEIEVALKAHLSDKTNWRKLLKGTQEKTPDLTEKKQELASLLPSSLQAYISDDNQITQIHYPVTRFPEKVKSVNLDKTPEFSGILTGIKGQYLMFDNQHVMNVRKYNGYKVSVTVT